AAFKFVLEHEPYAANCSNGVQLLKCRNVYQILGETLDKPCDLVVCWTPSGSGDGGTGLAIKIARRFKIPVIDLGSMGRPTLDDIYRLWAQYENRESMKCDCFQTEKRKRASLTSPAGRFGAGMISWLVARTTSPDSLF